MMSKALAFATALALGMATSPAFSSSHREAPLIAQDPVADNTDLYAFVSPEAGRQDRVVLIANFIPLEKRESGPNFWGFGEDVLYDVCVDADGDAAEDLTFEWRFHGERQRGDTFLYNTGVVHNATDAALNVRQTYDLLLIKRGFAKVIAAGVPVCPPFVGETAMPEYARIRQQCVRTLQVGKDQLRAFAGARAEQFFVDLGAVFDLLQLKPSAPVNATRDANVHTLALEVPRHLLTRDGKEPADAMAANAVIGVWSRAVRGQFIDVTGGTRAGGYVQVSRLGCPLVNEVVIPLGMKDRFNASHPREDRQFVKYVEDPELGRLFGAVLHVKVPPAPRADLVQIYLTGVPGLNQPPRVRPAEMLRLNLAIPPARQPDRMGVLGGDRAGYPNGRRPGDDVVDISLRAVAGVLVHGFDVAPNNALGDGVDRPDQPFLDTFPFLADPAPGR